MKIITEKILPWVLHNANAAPLFTRKKDFYSIKDQILQKYGTQIAFDIQHIIKHCYACDGTGIFKCDWKLPERCWRCSGGIYDQFFVLLSVYKFGKYEFHIPQERSSSPKYWWVGPDNKAIRKYFDDYINHKPFRWSTECNLLLFAIYRPKILVKIFGTIGFPNRWTPLSMLFTAFFKLSPRRFFYKIKWKYSELKSKWYRYRHSDWDDDIPF